MNLSFSTRGWESCSWDEWVDAAGEMHFGGIEVYNAHKNEALFEKGGPFHKYQAAATVRQLREKKLAIPCFDTSLDVSHDGDAVATMELLKKMCEVNHVTAEMMVIAYPECVGESLQPAKPQEKKSKKPRRRRGRGNGKKKRAKPEASEARA